MARLEPFVSVNVGRLSVSPKIAFCCFHGVCREPGLRGPAGGLEALVKAGAAVDQAAADGATTPHSFVGGTAAFAANKNLLRDKRRRA